MANASALVAISVIKVPVFNVLYILLISKVNVYATKDTPTIIFGINAFLYINVLQTMNQLKRH